MLALQNETVRPVQFVIGRINRLETGGPGSQHYDLAGQKEA